MAHFPLTLLICSFTITFHSILIYIKLYHIVCCGKIVLNKCLCLQGRKWHELSCQKKSFSNFRVRFHGIDLKQYKS